MFNSATRFLSSLVLFTFVLTYLWITAANAAEPSPLPGMTCKAKALGNGRPGETVQICTPKTTRTGVTIVVARLGAR